MTFDSSQPILQWIAAHPNWAGFAVFLISLSESLAVVGLVVPGVVMMTAIGAMMGAGILPFWETLLWAILGAIAGDGISYWLGYHFHEHLKEFWPFRQFPQLLARGEQFFKNHGGKSIIFGRFVGPVRPMIPVIAGMMDMTPKRFLFFNILSAIVWAPIYSLPGILIGVSLGTLSPEVARRVGLLILLLLLVFWLIYVIFLKFGMWIGKSVSKSINKLWLSVQASPRLIWLHKLLSSAQGTEEGQLGILILFLLSLVAFLGITINILQADGLYLFNEPLYQFFRSLYEKKIIDWVAFFSGLGDPLLLLITGFVIGTFLTWRKRYLAALCWFLTVGAGLSIGYFIRQWVAMPRPDGLVFLSHQYSYPSGHALAATLVFGLASAFIQPLLEEKHRYIPWLISIPLILFCSFSRLYLGLHWFTDILGGISLGICCVSFGMFLFRRFEDRVPLMRSILIPGLVTLSLGMTHYYFFSYPEKRTELIRQWAEKEFKTDDWWNNQSKMGSIYRSGSLSRAATVFNVQWLGSIADIKDLLKKNGFNEVPRLDFNSSLTFLIEHPNPASVPVLPKFHRDRLPVLAMTLVENGEVGKEVDKTNQTSEKTHVPTSEKPNMKTETESEIEDEAKQNTRLVLQLWNSDFVNEDGLPLWVGTLREEMETHPLPLTTIFQEKPESKALLHKMVDKLNKLPKTSHQTIQAKDSDTEILLIKTKSSTNKLSKLNPPRF